MDKDGNVLLSTQANHEHQRLALNDYFLQGLKQDYIQQPSYSLPLRKMTVVASAPVQVRGEVVGVIAGLANLDGLNQIMIGRTGLGETGETYLVGSNFRLLTYVREPGYTIPDSYIHTAGTEAAVGGAEQGSATYRGYSGATVVGVHDWLIS